MIVVYDLRLLDLERITLELQAIELKLLYERESIRIKLMQLSVDIAKWASNPIDAKELAQKALRFRRQEFLEEVAKQRRYNAKTLLKIYEQSANLSGKSASFLKTIRWPEFQSVPLYVDDATFEEIDERRVTLFERIAHATAVLKKCADFIDSCTTLFDNVREAQIEPTKRQAALDLLQNAWHRFDMIKK